MRNRTWKVTGVVFALLVVLCTSSEAAKTKIVFWSDPDPVTEELVAAFNRKSDTIEVVYQAEATTGTLSVISEKMMVALAAGVGPDVFRFNRPYASEWAAKDLLHPLEPYLSKFGIKREQFLSFAWDEGTYNGRVYILPEGADARGVFFNKSILSAAGVDANNMPQDLAGFDALAAKLTKATASGSYTQAGFIPWSAQSRYVFTWVPSFGGQLYDQLTGKITVNNPHNVQILDWMNEYAMRYGYTKLKGSFTSQTLAMNVETNGYTKTLNENKGLDYGVAFLPAPEQGVRKATYVGGFGVGIPASSKNPAAAAEFIAYWVSDEVQLQRAKAKGYFPATLKATRDKYYMNDPIQRIFIEMLPNAQARPAIPTLGSLWDMIKSMSDRVLVKNETPQAVADDVTRRAQIELDSALGKK